MRFVSGEQRFVSGVLLRFYCRVPVLDRQSRRFPRIVQVLVELGALLEDVAKVIAIAYWCGTHCAHSATQVGTALYIIETAGLLDAVDMTTPLAKWEAAALATAEGKTSALTARQTGGFAKDWDQPVRWGFKSPGREGMGWVDCKLFPGFNPVVARDRIEAWVNANT